MFDDENVPREHPPPERVRNDGSDRNPMLDSESILNQSTPRGRGGRGHH
jgi:hypothetical protein